MNYRLLTTPDTSTGHRVTARSHIVATLAEEILSNPRTDAFLLTSEHDLCRRFSVSRVTVRLALSDLENRGLIYRKHGKGTFAHGRSTRIHRHIGVLIKSPLASENRPLAEILRGVQTFVRPLRSVVILISQSPEEWQPELAGILSGVIVLPEQVTANDLDSLRHRKIPILLAGKTDLPGPRIPLEEETDNLASLFDVGQRAAESLMRAFLTGEPLSDLGALPGVNDGSALGVASMVLV